jgi:hypothetical protein
MPGGLLGMGGMGGGFGAGGVVAGGANDVPQRRIRKQHPVDIERNKTIEERLEKEVSMNFSNETPLDDVLKYIKETTKDAKGKTIPIYIDPIGLQNAEKTLQSAITLDLEDVPLRTTLRLLLAQLGLDYRVRDGMLYISDQDSLNEDDEFILPSPAHPDGDAPLTTPRRISPGNDRARLQ